MEQVIEKINQYVTVQPQWEKNASVRTRPRRMLCEEENPGLYFPPAHQPIAIHPLIEGSSPETKDKILILSLYKYLNDIANIEKDIINHVAYKITKNQYFIDFSRDIKHDALSIIVDESYHAYMAQDFIHQVQERTQVSPITLPEETAVSSAIQHIKKQLPQESIDHFEFIAVCIAEHALTNDLIAVAKTGGICNTFYCMMRDHSTDEGRHARYFETMLEIYWNALPTHQKNILGPCIPLFINQYFNPSLQREYDKKILESLNIEQHNIHIILEDTHAGWSEQTLNSQNIIVKQMISLLKRTKIYDEPCVVESFIKFEVH